MKFLYIGSMGGTPQETLGIPRQYFVLEFLRLDKASKSAFKEHVFLEQMVVLSTFTKKMLVGRLIISFFENGRFSGDISMFGGGVYNVFQMFFVSS